jgi:hypothetical protein
VLAYLSGAGLRFGFEVTTARSSSCAGAPVAVPSDRNRGLSGLELAGLGIFLAIVVVVPLIAGLLLDQVAHTTPLGLVLGLLIGIVAAGYGLWAQLRRYL